MENREKAIIIVAPNGARRTKNDHPSLPVTAEDVVADVQLNLAAGITMIHAHARKADGSHSLEIDDNLHLYDAIKTAVGDDVVIQLTTESVGMYEVEQQMAMVRAVKPEAVSLGLREYIRNDRDIPIAKEFFHWVEQQNIIAQFILYSNEDVALYHRYKEMGIIPKNKHHLLFVLGRYTQGQYSAPIDLLPFVLVHKDKTPWAACAFGLDEHRCVSTALGLGGDVRVGFENNMLDMYGQTAKNNAVLVAQVAETARSLGRTVMKAREFRELFNGY